MLYNPSFKMYKSGVGGNVKKKLYLNNNLKRLINKQIIQFNGLCIMDLCSCDRNQLENICITPTSIYFSRILT